MATSILPSNPSKLMPQRYDDDSLPVRDHAVKPGANKGGDGVDNKVRASVLDQMTRAEHKTEKGASSGAPTLLQPPEHPNGEQDTRIRELLGEMLADPKLDRQLTAFLDKFERDHGAHRPHDRERKQRAEQGDIPFNILDLAPNGIAMMVLAITLMTRLSIADNALSNKMTVVSFDATKASAAAMEREGQDIMASSISQAVFQTGITAVGARMSYKGIADERGALKNTGAKLSKLKAEGSSIKGALAAHNKATGVTPDGDELTHLKTKPAAGQNGEAAAAGAAEEGGDTIKVEDSNKRLSPEHHAVLSSRLQKIETEADELDLALNDSKLQARNNQTTGDVMMRTSQVVGNIASSSGQYAAAVERSDSQIAQAGSRVATSSSDESREMSSKARNILQDLVHMMDSITQSKAAAAGAIAGNIRI